MRSDFSETKFRRTAALAAVLLFALSPPILAADPADPLSGFAASSYLLTMDGKTVWARQPDRALPPASLTKIMTALIAIKRSRLDEIVVVSKKAAAETQYRLGLKAGEKMYVGFLLAASLLRSANDACHALADHVAGDETRFVALMNQEARALGMTNTHFTNSCGHDGPNHYSSARDLAILTEAALAEPIFSELVSTVYLDISTLGGKRVFHLENKNELVGRYPGAIGVKTGFTPKAGKCVIALVERDGLRALLVVLNAPDRWWGAAGALDAAFAEEARLKQVSRP